MGGVGFFIAAVVWAAITVGGLVIAEDWPTSLNLVLFSIPSLVLGFVVNRFAVVWVPFVVVLIAAATLDLASSCEANEECPSAGGVVLALFIAILPAAEMAVGVLARRGYELLRGRNSRPAF